MRDRETDSWWSIMSSDAIGGPLDGADLVELPVSEKTTWGAWREAHPSTQVLSVEGKEHVETNPYDNYFASDSTFRDLEVSDHRLAAKASIFSFWIDDRPIAAAHDAFAGGRILKITETSDHVLLQREMGSPIFASTTAYRLTQATAEAHSAAELLQRLDTGPVEGVERLPGFDTFWYNWVAVHPNTLLLK